MPQSLDKDSDLIAPAQALGDMDLVAPDLAGMCLVDIGANLSHESFNQDLEEVVNIAQQHGVRHLMITGTDLKTSQQGLDLCARFPTLMSATAGFHPHVANQCDAQSFKVIAELARHTKMVAIGETGLDYNRNFSTPQQQRDAFELHLNLAVEINKPLFLHQRDAHEDFLKLLTLYRPNLPAGGVVHCFTDTKQALRDYLDLDMYIGITGWICDERRGLELQEIVKYIPQDRLLLETDSPFLLPRNIKPRPKTRRNEPKYLPKVLETVAACCKRSPAAIAKQSTANAVALFGLEVSQ